MIMLIALNLDRNLYLGKSLESYNGVDEKLFKLARIECSHRVTRALGRTRDPAKYQLGLLPTFLSNESVSDIAEKLY